ncbi:hypothetical protein D9Q98_001892 [Chlorella vulgaris]|uniref:Uncharacterized protein n=1 Tax=Chlorella vulgaris TaxID=3077 RepID=A0A9D4TV94_CHLVU|nr:hypothetical protein D9Q98_001892 [Chlorella vulgaris]
MAALLCLSSFAAAANRITPIAPRVRFDGPEGPKAIQVEDDATAALVQQITAALAVTAQAYVKGETIPAGVTIASAPPANVSAALVRQVLGSVMAAAVMQVSSAGSLGSPKVYPYTDGTGRIALYRIPKGKVKGTCIFIHGCKHDPYSWFYRSKACPQCTGLPEEVSHSKQCLARGYAVLALMSLNREYRSRCFSSSGGPGSNDQASARDLIVRFTQDAGLTRRPKYMFGISSGASFAIKFPMTMYIEGVVSEVNMPWEKAWGATNGHGKLKVPFPPTAFYMMQRDLQTKRQIEKAVQLLNRNGVNSDFVFIPARAVTPDFLAKRSVFISPQQSGAIYAALVKSKVISKAGDVLYDVRVNRKWVKQLNAALPWLKRAGFNFNLISDESQIWQELNLAWAWHEIVSDHVRATLAWLETGGRANLNALARKYSLNDNIACLNEYREGCRR